MGKVIAVWGSPNSGKTTLSIKLAKELSKQNSVIVLFSDILAPVIPTIRGNIDTNKSLGNILSSASLDNDIIFKNCIEVDNIKNIGFLGYTQGENVFTYPQYTEERVKETIDHLKELVDYVIIDTSSNFVNDLITIVALETSDKVLRINSSELKNISYFDSYLPLLIDSRFKSDTHINILSNLRSDDAKDELEDLYKIRATIEHSEEIREQGLCSDLLLNLSSKEQNKLSLELNKIIYMINDDISQELKSQEIKKKGFFSRFRKGA
ncbi:AAA family ATPase [Paraclostridium sordellii]|uniref:AAA family ATPase n=1 Tax=Paraclostridium sordellii TaxID=1505 RepID=UPI000E4CDA31|nr:AAA family ATPase [Paeniclostridium sordellii]RGX09353.1 ParA family protein [Paeniclostridium sordellii]